MHSVNFKHAKKAARFLTTLAVHNTPTSILYCIDVYSSHIKQTPKIHYIRQMQSTTCHPIVIFPHTQLAIFSAISPGWNDMEQHLLHKPSGDILYITQLPPLSPPHSWCRAKHSALHSKQQNLFMCHCLCDAKFAAAVLKSTVGRFESQIWIYSFQNCHIFKNFFSLTQNSKFAAADLKFIIGRIKSQNCI